MPRFALGAGLVGEQVGLGDHPGAAKTAGGNAPLADQQADSAWVNAEAGRCVGDGNKNQTTSNKTKQLFRPKIFLIYPIFF